MTRVKSVTLNVCVYPTPAIPRPRGVEDAAPYGVSAEQRYQYRGKQMRKRRGLLHTLWLP